MKVSQSHDAFFHTQRPDPKMERIVVIAGQPTPPNVIPPQNKALLTIGFP